MSKAFTREDEAVDEDPPEEADALPAGRKNYVTPEGFEALRAELRQLMRTERPKIVEIVSWAAGNGDRSENGDYLYGKKRLREIDRRARYLTKRIESAELVDPARQRGLAKVFFGAHVTFARDEGPEETVRIVGIDEADATRGRISWLSPVARALLGAEVGEVRTLRAPSGAQGLEVIAVRYGEADSSPLDATPSTSDPNA